MRCVGEAARLARERGIGFVPGIEIDCNYRGTDLHLLGYGIDWRSADFARLEEEVAAKVMASFGAMVDNLLKLGFRVDAGAVLAAADGKPPTGELIAEVMLSDANCHTPPLRPYMEGGERSDMPYINFYLDYFAQGRPAFVPVEYMDYRDAVELVRDNGGVPVVAHPGLNFRGREETAGRLLDRTSSTPTTPPTRPSISPRWPSPQALPGPAEASSTARPSPGSPSGDSRRTAVSTAACQTL